MTEQTERQKNAGKKERKETAKNKDRKNETNKAARKNKAGLFTYLNPKNLTKEINRYGYQFSLSGFWKFYAAAFVSILVICFVYQLQLVPILLVLGCSILISPFIILNTYKNMYEQKRFLDVTNYLEQLLYSFRRQPKIVTSLQDSLTVFPEGRMHDCIVKAMDAIQNLNAENGDIYQNAFAEMEAEYECRRLKQAHDFLIQVEALGGDFHDAIDILLEDRRLWIERVYELEKERKNIKTKITVSFVLSFLVCGMTMFMLPKDFATIDHLFSQAGTTFLILTNILIWYGAQRKLMADWLSDTEENQEEIQRNYDRVVHRDKKKETANMIVKSVIAAAVLAAGVLLKSLPAAGCGLFLLIFSLMQPGLMQKTARKRILREVDKAFPVWLLELSLLLQTDNPNVALMKSVEHAPYVLKADLQKLVDAIEQHPASIEPYLKFMPQFDLPDVQSALRMLYSMSSFGSEDAKKQVMVLVERNNRLMDKAERIANEDSIAGTGTLILVPMLTGSLKMMVDLGVFLVSLLSMTNTM